MIQQKGGKSKDPDINKRVQRLEREVRTLRGLLDGQYEKSLDSMPETIDLLVGIVETEWISLPLSIVHEVIPRVHITSLPEVPAYIPGYIHWRGVQVPVIDLAARWHGNPLPIRLEDRIIIVNSRNQKWGLLLSQVDHLDRVNRSAVEAIPPEVPAEPYAFGVWRMGDQTVLLISVEQLVNPLSIQEV